MSSKKKSVKAEKLVADTSAGPLKVRNRVSAGTERFGLSFKPNAQPSLTCSKIGGGPSMIVILSSIGLPVIGNIPQLWYEIVSESY